MTRLSICIPTYNRARFLVESLDSVLKSAKGFEDRIEIIISDNAGTDNTKEVIERYLNKYPFIRYNRNEKNVFDKNFFIAAGLARGEYFWIFGDDDKMEEEAIYRIMKKIDLDYNLIICNYSVWNKDMVKVIKFANYNFNHDCDFNNSDKLIKNFGIKLQFISSIVIQKEVFLSVGEPECACFHEYGGSFLFALYSGIQRGLKGVLISKPIIRYRGFNSDLAGVERWYKYFSTGSALVLRALKEKGYSTWAVYRAKNGVLLDYIAKDISFRKHNGQDIKRVFGLIQPYYKFHLYFWAVIAPLIFMPIRFVDAIKKLIKICSESFVLMINAFKKTIKSPTRVLVWFEFLINSVLMSKVVNDGKVFYKYKGELYPKYLNKGNAISYIMEKAKQYCSGVGLDIGADIWPFPGAIPIRNEKYQNAYKLDNFENESLDYIISSHCLEHLEKWQDVLRLWIKKLKMMGYYFSISRIFQISSGYQMVLGEDLRINGVLIMKY